MVKGVIFLALFFSMLKKFLFSLLFLFPLASFADVGANCTFKGISLYGKVKIVNAFADIKVKKVNSFPDLKVKFVSSFPDSCGKWQIVNAFPDFTVQFVNAFEDVSIKEVSAFPGVN